MEENLAFKKLPPSIWREHELDSYDYTALKCKVYLYLTPLDFRKDPKIPAYQENMP